ncbi:NUDIX domain-containing protein [Nanoarchaeota archaeon]
MVDKDGINDGKEKTYEEISEEIVDVVNVYDEIKGQMPKKVCHETGLWHRGSSVFVFEDNSYEDIALQRRSKYKSSNPLKLCVPGGHVSAGETYLEAAQREFVEEMYDSVDHEKIFTDEYQNKMSNLVFEELFKIQKDLDNDYEFITVHRVIDPGPFNPDPQEVDEIFFMNVYDAVKLSQDKPGEFNGTSVLLLEEYAKRYL